MLSEACATHYKCAWNQVVPAPRLVAPTCIAKLSESANADDMKNGILRDDEGFDLLVDGANEIVPRK